MITALVKTLVVSARLGNRRRPRLFVSVVIAVVAVAIGSPEFALEVRRAHGAEAGPVGKTSEHPEITVFSADPSVASRSLRVVLLRSDLAARIQGLQGFRRLLPDEAALFIFEKPEPVAFWIGNVSYPIDIIFVGPDQKVLRTFPSCKPGSREVYPSGRAVKWVIETAAGSGIRAGDRVRF